MLIEIPVKKYILTDAKIKQVQSEENTKAINLEQKERTDLETSIRIYCLEVETGRVEKALVKKIFCDRNTGWIVDETRDFGTEKLTYESSNENIAMVDENGDVIGISEGEARITVSNGTLTDWCTAFVKKRTGGSATEGEPVFEIEVSSILDTGWTQNAVVKEGSLEGYTISYKVSDKIPTYDKRNEYLSSSSNSVISDKASDTEYFVWAIATKDNIDVCSTNCIRLRTGHTHIGSEKDGGKCYSLNYQIKDCTNTKGYILVPSSLAPEGRQMTERNEFRCTICGDIIPDGANRVTFGLYYSGGGLQYMLSVQCFECGEKIVINSGSRACIKHSMSTYSVNYRNR